YMAPELWDGDPVPASDQYALAVMAYEMLVGRTPYQGSLEQMMYQHIHGQFRPPSQLNPRLSPDVDSVFAHALAKRPTDRFTNISAFARALQQALLQTSTNPDHTVEATPASNAIRATLAISTSEATYGASRTLTLPNGQQVKVNVPAGTSNGQILRLEGLRTSSPTGVLREPLLLTILVTAPAEPASSMGTSTGAPTIIGSQSMPAIARTNHQGLSRGMTALLIVLALLLGGGSVAFFASFLLKNNATPPAPTTTVHGNATSTTQPNTPVSTPTVVVTPAVSQNPFGGTLALNDPLLDNSQGHGWLTGVNARGATCEFRGDGYYSTQPAQGFFHSCTANNTDFNNFAFETQMTLISGDYAGIIFCNATADTYYLFRIGVDGSYSLLLYTPTIPDGAPLTTGSISVNLLQPNQIAAVVSGGIIKLYLNRQFITSVNDSTSTHGRIAVFSWNQTGNVSQAVFRNAKVWTL
ncbi:MAG TPA: serine/threonine-protein kinase, partial [Ktedonobacteraceae bacterium]